MSLLSSSSFSLDADLRAAASTLTFDLRPQPVVPPEAIRLEVLPASKSSPASAVAYRGMRSSLVPPEILLPILDLLASAGIVVTTGGRRLVDESIGGVTTTNEVAWSDDPLGCWLIVDDETWRTEGVLGVTPPNPWLLAHGATVHEAPTLDALARAAGIDAAGLAATVDALRAAPAAAAPPRHGTLRLDAPPYRAVPLVAGVTFTLGGLRVDDHARVLDAHGAPIDGLHAAGGTMGGLHGGPRVGYAGGLLEAAVFGLLAGEHAGRALSGAPRAAGSPATPSRG